MFHVARRTHGEERALVVTPLPGAPRCIRMHAEARAPRDVMYVEECRAISYSHGHCLRMTAVCALAPLVLAVGSLLRWAGAGHNSEGASLIEVVSDDDSAVTRLEKLDAVHRLGLPHRGAWVFVVDETTHAMLLLRRAPHARTCPNTWSIVGEHNKPGETYEQAARRGAAEELGWSAAAVASMKLSLLGPTTFFKTAYERAHRTDRQHSAYALLRVPAGAPALAPDVEEASARRWVPLVQMMSEVRKGGDQFCNERIRSAVFEEGLRRVCAALPPGACGASASRSGGGGGGGGRDGGSASKPRRLRQPKRPDDALRLPARPSTQFFSRFTGRRRR